MEDVRNFWKAGLILILFVCAAGVNVYGYEVDETQNRRIEALEKKIKNVSKPNLSGIHNEIKNLKSQVEELKGKIEVSKKEEVKEEVKEEEPAAVSSSISYDFGVFTKYIWRGMNFSEDPVYQANVGFAQGGFSAGIFGNYQLGDVDRLTELDLTLDFAHSFSIVSCNIGYIQYTFPNVAAGAGRESAEIYLGLGVDTYAAPSITIYYDYQGGDGTYIESGVSHGFEIKGLGIEPSVVLGYNDHQWRTLASSFTNMDPGISFSYTIWKLNLSANWVYSVGLDDNNGFKDDHGWGGFNVNIGF